MIIYPAIDLRNKQCVRLYQGKFTSETVYSNDPFAQAQQFVSQGATWLHVIDLDGAKNPNYNQSTLMMELIQKNKVNVQVGGGIRTFSQIKKLLESGASRIIIGSLAIENPNEVTSWFKYFGGERIVLALDVLVNENNQPLVAMNAWQKISDISLYDMVKYYVQAGLTNILCTNINLDGTLKGPDFSLYASILNQYPLLQLQASGGIQSLSDLRILKHQGMSGAIVGSALYENQFTLAEALSC